MATVIQQARATTAFVQKAGKYYNVTPPDIHLLHTCVRSIPFHVVVTNGQLCVWEFHLNSLSFSSLEFALWTLLRRERAHCSEMKRLGQFSDGWNPMTNPSCFGQ